MEFKITPELAITLSSDNLELLVLPYQEGSPSDPNCPPAVDFRSYELKDGITMQLVSITEDTITSNANTGESTTTINTVNYLRIESGKIPPEPPTTALTYEVSDLSTGWPDISLKMIDASSNKMAAVLLASPVPAAAITCLPSNKIALSNVQTDIITIDFNLVNYVQVTSDGTKLTLIVVY